MLKHTYFATIALSFFILIFQSSSAIAANSVISENIFYLQSDAKSYLLHRSLRSNWPSYDLLVDKSISLDKFHYISPDQYKWDEQSNKNFNILKFNTGDYVVIYPDKFDKELSIDKQNVYTYKSWDGVKGSNGKFGFWNTPDNFSSFVYTWIVPADLEIISYKSNQKGNWVKRQNSITFFSTDSNNLTFEIRYKKLNTKNTTTNECLEQHAIKSAPVAKSAPAPKSARAQNQLTNTARSFDAPITLDGVNFHFGTAQLSGESSQILDRVALTLKQYPQLRIEIRGHTDSSGYPQSNLKLSQQRAISVFKYLIAKGVMTKNLSAKGYGETQPIADNKTREGRRQNRRVELVRLP